MTYTIPNNRLKWINIIISLARELVYEEQELGDYLKRQQDLEREERLAQREYEREKREAEQKDKEREQKDKEREQKEKDREQKDKDRNLFLEICKICKNLTRIIRAHFPILVFDHY